MTDDRLAGDERSDRVAHLTGLIQCYMGEWRNGDLDYGPWPEDPDGGELRLVMCLKLVLSYLPEPALALVETELLIPERRKAAHDRTEATLGEAMEYLRTVDATVAEALVVKIEHVLKENRR